MTERDMTEAKTLGFEVVDEVPQENIGEVARQIAADGFVPIARPEQKEYIPITQKVMKALRKSARLHRKSAQLHAEAVEDLKNEPQYADPFDHDS